jgi:hypothetical protein
MIVNKIKLTPSFNDRTVQIPIGQNWDLLNRSDTIDSYETTVLEEVIGLPINYELDRFSRALNGGKTQQIYTFYFKKPNTDVWENSFTYSERFTLNEVRKKVNSFKNSFFKLDLYDTMDPKKQKIYLSIIIRPTNGNVISRDCIEYLFNPKFDGELRYKDCCDVSNIINVTSENPVPICSLAGTSAYFITNTAGYPVNFANSNPGVYTSTASQSCDCNDPNSSFEADDSIVPIFTLDHVGNQEGYYIYWFQDKDLIDVDYLYMTSKFFDAKDGTYTKFTTKSQNNFSDPYQIPNEYFYYRVKFDYGDKVYRILDAINDIDLSNVSWFEYENPPLV